jgi:acetolactate synthase I/III small subunit
MKIKQQQGERHVLTITVDNEAGILAKIAGLFTARGYNIDSLTVADITENHAVSRITIVTHGPPAVIDTTTSSFIFELTGDPGKIDRFVALMRELGLVEVGRTGVVGMMRGAEGA